MSSPVAPQASSSRPPLPRFDTYEQGASMLMSAVEQGDPDEQDEGSDEQGGGLLSRMGRDVLETGKSIGRGAVNALDDTAETLIGLAARPFTSAKRAEEIAQRSTSLVDRSRDAIFGPRSDSGVQNFVEDTAQFVTGFIGTGKLKVFGKALNTLKPVVGGAVRGAIVDFAMFDPYKAQLAELAASSHLPGISSLGDVLSVEEDDGVVVSRFKRAAGGLIPGVALDGLVASARLLRNVELLKKADLPEPQRQAAQAAVEEQAKILDDIAENRHVPEDAAVVVRETEDGTFAVESTAPTASRTPDFHESLIGKSREEIDAALASAKEFDRNLEIEVLGEEAAARYRALVRRANSAFNLADADAASKELLEFEKSLTPEQDRRLFFTPGPDAESLAQIREGVMTPEEIAGMETGEILEAFAQIFGGNAHKHAGNQVSIANLAKELRSRGVDPTETVGSYLTQAQRLSPDDATAAARTRREELKHLFGDASDGAAPARTDFETRWQAEAQAASINEALAGRMAAKATITPEQTQTILALAQTIRDAGDDAGKLLDAFDKVRFNFNNLDAPEKTEALLRTISEALNPVFEGTQGRPVVELSESVDRALRLAGMLTKADAEDYLRNAGNVLKNADANILLLNSRITEHGESVAKWSAILDARPNDKVALEEARRALQAYVNLAADVAGANSGLGRGLNALKARGDDALKDVKFKEGDAPVPTSGTEPKAPDIIAGMTAAELREVTRLFRLTKEPKVLFDTLASELRPIKTGRAATVGRGLLEFFYNSVLSNPATHAAIFLGNGTVSVLEDSVRMMAGVLKRDPEMIRSAADLMTGRIIYGKQSIKGMGMALRAGHSIIDPKPIHKAIPGVAGEVIRSIGTRPMAAMDEFWRVNNNLAYVRMRSLRLARQEAAARGITGKRLDRWIEARAARDVRTSLDKATGASRLPEAREFAAVPTFSSPLREGTFGHDLEKFVQDHPLLTPILPFARTSLNVLDYSFAKMTPLGMFTQNFRKAMAAGGEEAAIAATRMAVGTTIWGTAGMLAFGGDITGRGPSDPRLRKMWLESHQPYSVKVGGKWVSYRRAEPFATALSVTADLAQILRDNSDDLETTEEASRVYYGIIAATVSGVTNKTYLSGLIDFMDAVGSGNGSKLKTFVDGLAQTAIPSVVNVINTDPHLRETKGMFDALVNRVPGWSQSLPAKYNAFGEPVSLRPSRTHRSLNPFPIRDAEGSLAEDELVELGKAFTPPPTVERVGSNVVNLHGRQYRNKNGGNDTPYERMMELMVQSDVRGKVERLMASPAYQNAGTGTSTFAGGRRYVLVQRLMDREYDRAQKRMLAEYPELRRDLTALDRSRRASRRSDTAGESILNQLR